MCGKSRTHGVEWGKRWYKPYLSLYSSDGRNLVYAQFWIPEIEPVGIIQFIHGLYDNSSRFQEAAEFFTARGYICVANDLLGHGNTAAGSFGFFGYNNGLQHVIEDVLELKRITRERYPALPYFVLGVSLGSLIERLLLTDISFTSDLNGAIIAATLTPFSDIEEVYTNVKDVVAKKGPKGISIELNAKFFEKFHQSFPNEEGLLSWLTSIKGRQMSYVKDKKTNFNYTNSAVRDIIALMRKVQTESVITSIEKRLPLLFISGKDDPVGDFGNGVRALVNSYIDAGIDEVSMRLFSKVRHDILFDFPATQNKVLPYINAWLHAHQ